MTSREPETRTFAHPDQLCRYRGRAVNEKAAHLLAADMAVHGQLQDGTVAPVGDGTFAILIGNTRHRACQIAELPFRARILPEMPAEQEILRMQVSENLRRRSLTPFERGDYLDQYKRTLPKDATWEQVAEGLGMKASTVLLHIAPKRIPERLRPLCEGLGATIICLIGRIQKIEHMEKAIQFAREGATKDQIDRFVKQLAKAVGRKNGKLVGKLEGLDFAHAVKPSDTAADVAKRLEEAVKKLYKVGNAPAHACGYLFA